MQARKILKPGLLITIELRSGEDWPFVIGYASEKSGDIICEVLMDYPEPVDINKGSEIVVTCLTEEGVFRFPTRVTDVEQDPLKLTLSLLRGANHLQRREFFRLSRPHIRVRYTPVEGPEDILGDNMKEAAIKDLSGNGIAIVVPMGEELEEGTPIKIEIDIPNGRNINLIGEIMRCVPNEPINGMCLLCTYFALIEEKERDRIIGHLFREQLERAGRRRQSRRRT